MDNSAALIQDVIKQQIDLEVQELQKARNIYVPGSRFHNITMLQGQLAFYVGAAKAESIVMNLYMERMSDVEEQNSQKLRNEITRLSAALFDGEVVDYCIGALRSHGCVISVASDRYDIFFPQGTVQEEIFPRTLDMRYKILFPDGFEIQSVVRRGSDLYLLKMPRSILPTEFL